MSQRINPLLLSPALLLSLGPVVAIEARAERYMSENEAAELIFPGEKFTSQTIELSEAEAEKIADISGERVRTKQVQVLRSPKKNFVFIDQVLGKHEFITYAIGIGADGKVRGVEILDYRESYGYQVRNQDWRAQFHGKDVEAPLKLTKDIKNITGATLSSAHITSGVRRILRTYEAVRIRI